MTTDESAAVSNPHLQREIDLASERPTSRPARGNSLGVCLLIGAVVAAGAAAGVRSWRTPAGSTLASADVEPHARLGAPVIPDAVPAPDVHVLPPKPVHVAVAAPVAKRSRRPVRRPSRGSSAAALPRLFEEAAPTPESAPQEWIFEEAPLAEPAPVVPLQKAEPTPAVPVQSPAPVPSAQRAAVPVQTPTMPATPVEDLRPVAALEAATDLAPHSESPQPESPRGPSAAAVQPPSTEAPAATSLERTGRLGDDAESVEPSVDTL